MSEELKKNKQENDEKVSLSENISEDRMKKSKKEEKDKNMQSESEAFAEDYSMEEFMLLKQQNDEYSREIEDLKDSLARKQAEFENYKKRILKESDEAKKYSGIHIYKDLLNLMDNFDRALEIDTQNEQERSFLEGFEMIFHQFQDILMKNHVEEVSGVGSEFDPNIHQAISFEEKDNVAFEQIDEVFQKGYMLYERVLRPATVKVAKPAANDEADSEDDTRQGDDDSRTESAETNEEES